MPNGCLHQGRDEVVAEPEPEKCEMADDAFAAVHVAVVALVGAPVGVAAVVVVVVAAAAAVAAAVVAAAAAAVPAAAESLFSTDRLFSAWSGACSSITFAAAVERSLCNKSV